jgi:hypothetical protein
MNTDRIRSIDWSNSMSSMEAMRTSMRSLLDEVRAGRH